MKSKTRFFPKVTFVLIIFLLLASACRPAVPTSTPAPSPQTPATPVPTNAPARMTIMDIQGKQHRSPLDGKAVEGIQGVITAVRGNGLYIQDPAGDGDDHTSDAIFVATSAVLRYKKGDLVEVAGQVREFNPAGVGANSLTITEIKASSITVLESGLPLPEPVLIGKDGRAIPNAVIQNDATGFMGRSAGIFDPEEDGMDFYESLESMLVQVNNALAVGPTSGYKELPIVADLGENATVLSKEGVLVIRDGDFNPEKILLDDSLTMMPTVAIGSVSTKPIIGIMDFTFGNYKFQPVEKVAFTEAKPYTPPTIPALSDDQLLVATYNVENLNALELGNRFNELADHIVNALNAPDILALQEIQDDDGPMPTGDPSAVEIMNLLINAIQAAGGPEYFALNIDPEDGADGGQIGSNIRVVMLYRTDRGLALAPGTAGGAWDVTEVKERNGNVSLSFNPGRLSPQLSAFRESRKSLIGHFTFNGSPVIVINNHLKSKGEDGPLYGDQQPPPLPTEKIRIPQAQAIGKFVQQVQAVNPDAHVIVLGDLNDFYFSRTLKALEDSGLNNLIMTFPEEDRFTYIYDGNGQTLDHILVTDGLLDQLAGYYVPHINTLTPGEHQVSDHDPVLAIFNVP